MAMAMRMARSGGNLPCSDRTEREQAAFHPLHHHVDAAALGIGEHAHDAGVVHLLADLALAAEAVEQGGVGFHLGMRNFDGHLAAVTQIRGAENDAMPLRATKPSMR